MLFRALADVHTSLYDDPGPNVLLGDGEYLPIAYLLLAIVAVIVVVTVAIVLIRVFGEGPDKKKKK